jgi:RNA polymerase sigma factor (sigma-70 family)
MGTSALADAPGPHEQGHTGSCMTNDSSQLDRRLADLMRAAQAGDQFAYAQVLNVLAPLLRRTIKRWRAFLKPEDIEDLVQDTLLSLHQARATYSPERPLLPWVMAIARNRVTDGARRYIARAAHEVVVDELPETFSGDETNIEGGYGDPEALRLAIAALPPGQRQAIEMMKLREMSLKEAAAHSGMSIAALKVAAHRAMIALRKAMGTKA